MHRMQTQTIHDGLARAPTKNHTHIYMFVHVSPSLSLSLSLSRLSLCWLLLATADSSWLLLAH